MLTNMQADPFKCQVQHDFSSNESAIAYLLLSISIWWQYENFYENLSSLGSHIEDISNALIRSI